MTLVLVALAALSLFQAFVVVPGLRGLADDLNRAAAGHASSLRDIGLAQQLLKRNNAELLRQQKELLEQLHPVKQVRR